MCGHAGLTVGAGAVGEHVRRAGCPVDQAKPSSYETGTNKTAKKGSNYPAVVQKRDALSLETRTFGVARLRGTHCVFDGWMQKPTWAKAAKSATGRCAVVVTSFVEGITCRRPDDKVFFILALAIGDDSFVILTTDAKQTSLLGERARKSEGFGSGRCPLYADGAQAARWCAATSAEDPAAVAAEIEVAREKLEETAPQGAVSSVGSILSFQTMTLKSPDFRNKVHAHIQRGITAERGVQDYFRVYRGLFKGNPAVARTISDLDHLERRLLRSLLGRTRETLKDLSSPVILIAADLDPTTTAELPLDKILGFATDTGGQTSHTAIVAKSRNIPAVVGLGSITTAITGGETVILDGLKGRVIIDPDEALLEKYRKRRREYESFSEGLLSLRTYPAETEDGYQVRLFANIEFPSEVPDAVANGAEGIGLYRTEFLFSEQNPNPSEEEHYEAYREALQRLAADGVKRPLVIRTLDLGADKFNPDRSMSEMNPFLGQRSIRWCFAHRDVFMNQLHAILRVSTLGDVRIMLPMISSVEDLLEALDLIEDAKSELRRRGQTFDESIKVGIMIEVPSAALMADVLAQYVDFFSVGTNDLVQYTMAVDRVNERVARYYQPAHPAIFRLLLRVVEVGRKMNKSVSICGEISGDPIFTLALLGLGVRDMSMAPASIPQIKKFVRSLRMRDAVHKTRSLFDYRASREAEAWLLTQAREIVPDLFA